MLARIPQSRVPRFSRRLLLALVAGAAGLFALPVVTSLESSLEFRSHQPSQGALSETSSVRVTQAPNNVVADAPARADTDPFDKSSAESKFGLRVESSSISKSSSASDVAPRVLVAAQPVGPTTVASSIALEDASPQVLLLGAEDWDLETLSNVQRALASLPPGVTARLGNRVLGELRITVSTDGQTSAGSQPYGGAANFFTTNDAMNEIVLYPRQPVQTILHELGHAYNLRSTPAGNYASVLLDAEMKSFMAIAGWQVLTSEGEVEELIDHAQVSYSYDGEPIWAGLSHNDPLEDFANSFALYYGAPEQLAELSPARYLWFRERF